MQPNQAAAGVNPAGDSGEGHATTSITCAPACTCASRRQHPPTSPPEDGVTVNADLTAAKTRNCGGRKNGRVQRPLDAKQLMRELATIDRDNHAQKS